MRLLDLTETAVQAALRLSALLFSRQGVDAIMAGFADDVRVHFCGCQPISGKRKLRALLEQRFASMRECQCLKKMELLQPPQFASASTETWIDVPTNTQKEGFGLEPLAVQDGLFADWSTGFSAWPAGQALKV